MMMKQDWTNFVGAEENLSITNGGFEEPLGEDGDITGWNIEGDGGTVSVTDELSNTGNYSLHLADTSGDSALKVESDRFEVNGLDEYKANAWMNVKDQSHSVVLEIWFYDSNGNSVGNERKLYSANNKEEWLDQWYEMEIRATAPNDAETAEIWFLSGDVSETNVYFDDVSVQQVSAEHEEEEIEIENPGFENVSSEGEIIGWSQLGEGGELQVSTDEKTGGEQSLYFHDEDSAHTFTALSDPIEVTPGNNYKAEANMHVVRQTHSVVFELQYYDSDDELITASNNLYRPEDSDIWLNQWFAIDIQAPAPTRAEYVRIVFHSGTPSITEAYFDDVVFKKINSDSGELELSDDFLNPGFEEETDENDNIVGWDSSDGISVSNEEKLNGNYSLKLEDSSETESVWARSNPIQVEPGKLYNILGNMFVESQTHSVVFELSFHDVNGATIGKNINALYRDVEKNTWKDMNLVAEAPENAAYMQVHVRSGGVSKTQVYFDDFSYTEVERSREKPSAMSDEAFFGKWDQDTETWLIPSKLDYQYSKELGPVEQAVKQGDYEQAEQDLLYYYQSREGYQTLEDFGSSQNSEVTALIMDWILTLAGERYVETITVDEEYQLVQGDVTSSVKNTLDEADEISFLLMSRYKGVHASFHSTEKGEHPPILKVTVDSGESYEIIATKDTFIHAGQPESNFGEEEELQVKDEGAPYNDETRKSYIYFDLSEIEGDVTDATIKLYGKKLSNTNPSDLMIYETDNTGWNEQELSWSNHYGKTFSWQGEEEGADWKRPEYSDSEYFYQIPRFYFANTLMAEYLATSEEIYTDHLIDMMLDFIYDTEAYGGEQGAGSYPRTLDSAIRAFNWINAYHVLRETDSLDASTNTEILKTLWKTARFLESEFNDNNWGVIESKGFYHVSTYFPEFEQSAAWESLIHDRLEYLFDTIYLKDGGYAEASTTYASIAINEFLNIKKFGTMNNKIFSEDFDKSLQRAGKYLIDISFPNGIDPIMGDSSNTNHKPVIKEIAELTNDLHLLYVGTGGEEGIKPPYTSTIYPIQRSAVLRSGWDQENLYLHMNTATGAHEHPDELSTIVYGYGRPLIVDPGAFTYSHDDISNWLRKTTEAHNTIEINGKNQDSSLGGEMSPLVQNERFDFLTGETYATKGFTHTRNIMFIKSGFWIVSDHVTGGSGENTYKQNWHFPPKANLNIENESKKSVTSFDDEGPDIQVVPADPEELNAEVLDGYYSEKFYSVEEAKYSTYEKKEEGDVNFDTVLYPVQHGDDTDIQVERIPLNEGQDTSTAMKIIKNGTNKELTGYYYLNHDEEQKERTVADYSFTGKSVYLEEDDKGKLSNANVVSGSKLEKEDQMIVNFDRAIRDLSLNWDRRSLEITSTELVANNDVESAAPIYAPTVNKVTLNGEEIPFERRGQYIYAVGLSQAHESNLSDEVSIQLGEESPHKISFDLIPTVEETEGYIQFNRGQGCDSDCMLFTMKLNENGLFEASEGSTYQADYEMSYLENQLYHMTIEVDPIEDNYNVYVKPEGGFNTLVAENYPLNQKIPDSGEIVVAISSSVDKDFTIKRVQVLEE